MSHMEENNVTQMIDWLKNDYGEMYVFRWEIHEYLGMTLNFKTPGGLKVIMIDYLRGVLRDFPELITGSAATPTGDRLFEVRSDHSNVLLDDTRVHAFHHALAQLWFSSII
jgi:hypothetical protein